MVVQVEFLVKVALRLGPLATNSCIGLSQTRKETFAEAED